ncbi:MAG: hypothetical protein EOP82_22780 [Variovorax sp.]|nr:MAG: hypothetical protein EOP82_22780 [Variovorax sp.]
MSPKARYKARSIRRSSEGQRIALLLIEPTLLVVAHQRTVITLILWLTLLGFATLHPVYGALIARFPEANPFREVGIPQVTTRNPYVPLVTTVLSMLAAMAAQYRFLNLFSECRSARRRVEQVAAERVAEHAEAVAAAKREAQAVTSA